VSRTQSSQQGGASTGKIAARFAALKAKDEGALIPFIVAGDPDLAATVRIMAALARAGADVIELGVPFSDPLADGPVNQAAYDRALRAGATVERVLDAVARFRADFETPVVLMTYSNPIAQYGWERFAASAAKAGVAGVLLTDLPPEEAEPWLTPAHAAGLDTIFLLAPTSPDARIALVSKLATGYVYCVSRLGVTGARDEVAPEARILVERVRTVATRAGAPVLPVVVGFGIARPEQVRAVCEFADGAVVGSALVSLIGENITQSDLEPAVVRFASALKAATVRGA
jgi:tryptophan synthase alpha chain